MGTNNMKSPATIDNHFSMYLPYYLIGVEQFDLVDRNTVSVPQMTHELVTHPEHLRSPRFLVGFVLLDL